MNYLQEIRRRSIILWRAVFARPGREKAAQSVYIVPSEQAAAPKGAAVQAEVSTGGDGAAAPAAEGRAESVLRGLEETEAAAFVRGLRWDAEQEPRRIAEGTQTDTDAPRESTAVQSAFSVSAQPGEGLFADLRAAEDSALRAVAPQVSAASWPLAAVRTETGMDEQWSACIEKDARRYDGACELM